MGRRGNTISVKKKKKHLCFEEVYPVCLRAQSSTCFLVLKSLDKLAGIFDLKLKWGRDERGIHFSL